MLAWAAREREDGDEQKVARPNPPRPTTARARAVRRGLAPHSTLAALSTRGRVSGLVSEGRPDLAPPARGPRAGGAPRSAGAEPDGARGLRRPRSQRAAHPGDTRRVDPARTAGGSRPGQAALPEQVGRAAGPRPARCGRFQLLSRDEARPELPRIAGRIHP